MNSTEVSRSKVGDDSVGPSPAAAYKQTQAWQALRRSWFGAFVRGCKGSARELRALLRSQPVSLPDVRQLQAALASLPKDASSDRHADEAGAPIFLLSTGWRAGSTLLQRVLVTDQRLFLWGEPLGEMVVVSRIAEMIGNSISPRNLKLWMNQQAPNSEALSTSWIANLYPATSDFRFALRDLFDRWLGKPAREHGFARWGFKEVRFGATEAALLHWLYPNAKFVTISRHPFDCYRSLYDAGWKQVYYRYPDVLCDSATDFARVWNRVAVSWSHLPSDFPCFHIKYEDLVARKVDFRRLESWLGIEINEKVALSAALGSTAERAQLSWYERWAITHEAADGMRALGYDR